MKQKIAIQGELGSYSHLASTKVYKDPEVIPCKTFNDTLDLVKKNKDIVAVIPIENLQLDLLNLIDRNIHQ